MARRNTARKSKTVRQGSQLVVIFWLVFILVIISIFMINAATIQRNFNIFRTRMTSSSGAEEEILALENDIPVTVIIEQPPASRPAPEPAASVQTPPAATSAPPATTTTTPAAPATTTRQPPAAAPVAAPVTAAPPPAAPVQTRERAVYFTHVGSDGQILHSRVIRRVPVSESPMQDALNVLLAGPSADEIGRGVLNLIPQNTRLLSAAVRGSTAYLNFSEDFLFNTFGVEGYVAQLRQIVWTVTEFSNVRDVQFLIDGRRHDYLGEGIWIGSPISRLSF